MTRSCLHLIVFLASSVLWSSPSARTWYVAADGSGDAPTIAAAIDSSEAGDTILAGPGDYFIGAATDLKANTALVSELGPAVTTLAPVAPDQSAVFDLSAGCALRGFTIYSGLVGTLGVHGPNVEISNNIIENTGSGGIYLYGPGPTTIHHNLLYGYGPGIYDVSGAFFAHTASNNIIYGGIVSNGVLPAYCNDGVNSTQGIPIGQNNFSEDPMFCGVDNYYLQSDSPCAPGNHPGGFECDLIGPLPVGCGNVPVELRSWGSVKAMYRE